MFKSLLKNKVFLWLGVITLVAGVIYYLVVDKNNYTGSDFFYQRKLQKKISLEINNAQIESNQIKEQYNATNPKSFQQIKIATLFPYYIYKNGKISYWSNNNYIPEYETIKNIKNTELIEFHQNKGIFLKNDFKLGNDDISIVSIVYLYRHYQNQNDYLQSSYNDQLFQPFPLKISKTPYQKSLDIKSVEGEDLFYFTAPQKDNSLNTEIPKNTLIFLGLTLIFFALYIFGKVRELAQVHKFGAALLLLFVFGFITRIIMLVTGLPFSVVNKEFLNPTFYEGNMLSPTFGDTVINGAFLLVFLTFAAYYFYRSQFFSSLSKTRPFIKSLISVLLVIGVMALGHFMGYKIESIYENSMYNLGYSLDLGFSKYRVISFAYYFLLLCNYFLASHIAINIFLKIQSNTRIGFFHWLYGFIAGSFIFFFWQNSSVYFLFSGIFFLSVYFFKLSRFFYALRFQTLLYFILAAFCFALISIVAVEKQETKKNLLDKKNFGLKYLADNDLLGEGLLDRFGKLIKNDSSIINTFSRQNLTAESISQQIKDSKLDMYFDKYDVDVKVFDATGNNFNPDESAMTLTDFEQKYRQDNYKTDVKDLFFVNETGNNFIKEYVYFNQILSGQTPVGTVVLDLKLKDENTNSVYPELLLDKKYVQNPESKQYSYGIFDNTGRMIFNSGSFNYMMNFPLKNLENQKIFEEEQSVNGFTHLAIKGSKGRIIIVSQQDTNIKKLLSNFSFLFLMSIMGISLLLSLFAFLNGFKSFSMNFSTKIQLYLNGAFLLPLIILIILTLSVVRTTLVTIQEKSFLDNTKNIASTVKLHLENYQSGKMSKGFFEGEINELSRNTKVDINIYNQGGRLTFSTRPLVYQYHLLSTYLNPVAYSKIVEQKANETISDEALGTLNYKTVYLGIKSGNNHNLGVVGIPFFDSKTMLDQQVKEVVATILIIFLFMFLLLLVLSYFASSNLTAPLKLIAQKLKKTNLDKLDESIEWGSNDEIGLMTKSYNKMLKKLNESKLALSQSEKQTAWREMAKQVAHEIKNPLTPMKLSIQQLQRTLPMDDPKSRDRIQRALNSLNEQIDNISEIANSFSEFAKMPVPRNERFELVASVQKTTDLYSQNNNIKIDFDSSETEVFVLGDRMLVNRVITNLILNGIQSVPPIRQPEIKVKVYKNEEENFGMIEVKDNGSGIPEEIRKKVFIPNFSTKVGGSGLGLAMAKRGIEHAGGNIWFETEEGVGTTFFIDLPIF